jgi:hypothetical protein
MGREMDLKKNMKILAIVTLISLLSILIASPLLELNNFEGILTFFVLMSFAVMAYSKIRSRTFHIISYIFLFPLMGFISMFFMVLPLTGLFGMGSISLMVVTISMEKKVPYFVLQCVLLGMIILSLFLFYLAFPIPME